MNASRASSRAPIDGSKGLRISAGVSRRRLLGLIGIAPFLQGAFLTAKGGFARGHDDLVVRNGWILRTDDLDRLA